MLPLNFSSERQQIKPFNDTLFKIKEAKLFVSKSHKEKLILYDYLQYCVTVIERQLNSAQ